MKSNIENLEASRNFSGRGCIPPRVSFSCLKAKSPTRLSWALALLGLGDDLLSHGYDRTIIGATSFHGPVRDGKGWVQRAMVAKNLVVVRPAYTRDGQRHGVGEVKR
jgi:hypothetical protein